MSERYLSPPDVTAIIPGMTEPLLAQMRFRGDGPPFVKPSPKKVVYPESKLYAWLEEKTQTSTKESA